MFSVSNPVATEDPLEMTERMNSFENMMLARNEEERMARLYNFPHHNHMDQLHPESTPQDPVEGDSRHGKIDSEVRTIRNKACSPLKVAQGRGTCRERGIVHQRKQGCKANK